MINELYELAEAMEKHRIEGTTYAQNYNDVSYKECVCVCLSGGQVCDISPVTPTQKANIRNYTGTSIGGFPCVKLAPLYRITNKDIIQTIKSVRKQPELLDAPTLSLLKGSAVSSNNNWDGGIIRKYENAYQLASKIRKKLSEPPCPAFEELWKEFETVQNPETVHAKLTQAAEAMLSSGSNVALMLSLLFYCVEESKSKKTEEKSNGEISVLWNAKSLYELGMPVTSMRFTEEMNNALLAAERQHAQKGTAEGTDAFGKPYFPSDEVMPNVKIGAGFFVKLRTMNKDVPCLHRYGQEGCMTFPAAHSSRMTLQRALNYIGAAERDGKTWMCIDKLDGKPRDVLFAYPLEIERIPENFATFFQRPEGSEHDSISFSERSKLFIEQLKKPDGTPADQKAQNIRIFILRRLDVNNNSGRAKVVYTCHTDPYELEKCSIEWALGCADLPNFPFGVPETPYPLDVADILNRFWKQNGEPITEKFQPFQKYHGIELLMAPELPITVELHRLSESAMTIGPHLGGLRAAGNFSAPIWEKVKNMLALMGLFLHRRQLRKEDYMENLPYLYGQLLKAADELQALYCKVVRNGDVPAQLAGSALFQSAAEAPVRTMHLLSQRIMPYYSWAKSYRLKGKQEPGKESWRAGWLYGLCEDIMDQLRSKWSPKTRFTDEEKVQLFIGYLGAFPKKEQGNDNIEEETTNE